MMTDEEVTLLLKQSKEAASELKDKLDKIAIKIDGQKNPAVVEAVRQVFGDSYINSKGGTTITYDMYCSVLNLIRTLGTYVGQESI